MLREPEKILNEQQFVHGSAYNVYRKRKRVFKSLQES